MTLAELLPAARNLIVTEKVKLIRILAEDLDTDENNQLSESLKKPIVATQKIKKLRPFGLCAGEFVVPEDFDAPLPEEILQAFEGK